MTSGGRLLFIADIKTLSSKGCEGTEVFSMQAFSSKMAPVLLVSRH